MGSNEFTILSYGAETEEWKASNAKLRETTNELSNRIALSLGLWGLWGELGDFEEDKIWKANAKKGKKKLIDNCPQF